MAETEDQQGLVMTRVGGGRSAGAMMVAFVLLVGGGWLVLALDPPAGTPPPSPAAAAASSPTDGVLAKAPPEAGNEDPGEPYEDAPPDTTTTFAAAATLGDQVFVLFLRQTSAEAGTHRGEARLELPFEMGRGSIELLHSSVGGPASSWYSVGDWPILVRPQTTSAGRALFTAGRPARDEDGSPEVVGGGFWVSASARPDGEAVVLTVDVISPWEPRGGDFDECDWSVPVWDLHC